MFRFVVFFFDLIFVIQILVLLLGPHVGRDPNQLTWFFNGEVFHIQNNFKTKNLKMNYIFNCQKLEKNAKNCQIIFFILSALPKI
jgi:hypothetical protein